jgi:hypothetical protein
MATKPGTVDHMKSEQMVSQLRESPQVSLEETLATVRRRAMEQEIKSAGVIANLRLDLSRALEELRTMHRHCEALARRLEAGGGDIDTPLADQKPLERMFFRPDGRPVKPLRRLLFHTSGKPRRIFRRVVLHKDGTPRKAFARYV